MTDAEYRLARIRTDPDALEVLPSLAELGVRPEIVEAVEEIFDGSDVLGVERGRLELALRLAGFYARAPIKDDRSDSECGGGIQQAGLQPLDQRHTTLSP